MPSRSELTPLPVGLPELPARFVLIFPTSRASGKDWPWERFAATAQGIAKKGGHTIVLAGMPQHRETATRIRESLGELPCLDLTGKLTTAELVGVMARASLVVSNDSAGIHLAAALGRPGVGIANGRIPGRFYPYPTELAPLLRFVYPSRSEAFSEAPNVTVEAVLHASLEALSAGEDRETNR